MSRYFAILAALALVIALPFLLRQTEPADEWRPGDPELIVITPHNEAIRREFGRAFAAWHRQRHGRPAKVDWRSIGGTTEIMRYLEGEYVTAFRAWWGGRNQPWPEGAAATLLDRRFDGSRPPPEARTNAAALRLWEQKRDLHTAFRRTDDPAAFSPGVDLFFGGGTYDHGKAQDMGLLVPPWPATNAPPDTLATADGRSLIPTALGGETWRTPAFFGAAVSAFGICYNTDRLRDLGIAQPPARWEDLADPAYFGQIGVADPTKSGSIAKAFEMIVHEQCLRAVERAGFSREQTDAFEAQLARKPAAGQPPPDVPAAYPRAVETGWLAGVRLVQRIGANARYFTDSASKVPIDVSMGNAAAGVAIDFYGRFQAEVSRLPDGRCPLVYVTPAGGSSVSADPIGLLRGAPHRDVAIRFMRFVLGEEGQRLWTYRPGEPGGPSWYALRRLPIRRDFYPSDDPAFQAAHRSHLAHAADALDDPTVNPYALAEGFVYRPRWTGGHFNVHRTLIRAMCMDAGEELRAAWRAILDRGGPAAQPAAMAALGRLPDWPEPLTWESAPRVARKHDPIECLRRWTVFFRASYAEARRLAERSGGAG